MSKNYTDLSFIGFQKEYPVREACRNKKIRIEWIVVHENE